MESNRALLRDRDPKTTWQQRLVATFDSHVRGPVFEEQERTWVRRYAGSATLGGNSDYLGPSVVSIAGIEHQLDVVVATGASDIPPAGRTVVALGEAKAGETIGHGHLHRLEQARTAIGLRAAHAKLLLFAPTFTDELRRDAQQRADIELIDLDRLYYG